MKATVLLAGVPDAERRAVTTHLQKLGACVLKAASVERALEHVTGGAVDALVLDIALRQSPAQEKALAELLRESRRRSVLLVGAGVWPRLDGVHIAAQLDKPLEPELLARLLTSFLG